MKATEQCPKPPAASRRSVAVLARLLCVRESGIPAFTRCCALAISLVAFFALTAVPAQAFRGHVFATTFGSASSTVVNPEPLSEPSAVAVNRATGQVYVLDQGNGRIERFSSSGAYEAQFDGSATPATTFDFGTEPLNGGLAVDNSCYYRNLTGSGCVAADPSNGDLYVTDREHGVVDKFSSAGAYLGQLQEESGGGAFKFTELSGVAVSRSGAVLAYGGPHVSGDAYTFSADEPSTFVSHRQLENAGGTGFTRPGFAIDSEDTLYARRQNQEFPFVSKYSSSGANLMAEFDPEETSAVAVDLSSDEVFLDNVTSLGAFSSTGALQERFGSGHVSSGAGLAVGTADKPLYTDLYVADRAAGDIVLFAPEPPGPPTIESDSVTAVTADSATLTASVNPRSEPGEGPTEYRFEYGPCASPSSCGTSAYDATAPIPAGELTGEFEARTVSAHLQGLLPHTNYHFRVLAENQHGAAAPGEERTFTTQVSTPFLLADGRAWELVSPPDKHGAALLPITGEGLVQASAAGDGIAYPATAPTESAPEGNTNLPEVLSTHGPGGWSSGDLTIPHAEATGIGVGEGEEIRAFSADLSLSLLQPFGSFESELSPQATEQTPYLRTDFPPGDPAQPCAASCYRPIITAAEGLADVPSGTKFGEEGKCPPILICGPKFLGATGDFTHLILRSGADLTETKLPANGAGLYEWTPSAPAAESVRLVSVLPASEGGEPVRVGELGSAFDEARNAISADGSRVVWSDGQSNHLYLRDLPREETIKLDAVQGGSGTGEIRPHFQLASADGSRVFFTDQQRLTPDSGGGAGLREPDLYECRLVEAAAQLECALTDITPITGGVPAAVQGLALGASADGSYLYFVANGVLAPNGVENGNGGESAEPGNCLSEVIAPGSCNLYLLHAGRTTFVAGLSAEDFGDFPQQLAGLTARVSSDGHWLAFMSKRPLTGYDNRDASSGVPDEEVFLYHAPAAEGEAGRLICASCNPTGARPHGREYGPYADHFVTGGENVWPNNQWLAANVPGWTSYEKSRALYQSRYLSDSGRLFFNSSDALAPTDANSTEDVYQYEPPRGGGVVPPNDTCTTESPTYSLASAGCISLLSSGSSQEESGFLDASESGNDVFFLTSAQLSYRDNDSSRDVYDASVGGSETEAVKPVECQGDACQLAAQAPNDSTPGSLTFHGAGNVLECPKGKVKKAGKCVAKKHSRNCKKGNVHRHGKCVAKVHREKHHKKRAHKRAGSSRGGQK